MCTPGSNYRPYTTMEDFKDKVVIITGASSGIGAHTAVDFARCGAKLALTGRNVDNLKHTIQQCIEAGASEDNIHWRTGDVTVEEDVNAFIDGTVEKFKRINVLVNNAGAVLTGGIQELEATDMDAMYRVNVRSAFMVTKRALPKLIESKGSVVNVSSIAGTRPVGYCLAYTVAKAALNTFTQCLANELAASGVRVSCVCPGAIRTPIFTRPGGQCSSTPEKIEEFYDAMGTAHPMQRVGDAGEVSSAIRFLASDAASFTTGAIFPVDGGRLNTVSRPEFPMTMKH